MADAALTIQEVVNLAPGTKPSFPALNSLAIHVLNNVGRIAALEGQGTLGAPPNALDTYNSAATGGSSTAYTATFSPSYTSLIDAIPIYIKPHVTCGDNPTINLDGLGAKNIQKAGVNIASGELVINRWYLIKYNATLDVWEVMSAEAAAAATASVPAGARLLFFNTAAPSGWTFLGTNDDRAVIVTGTEANGGTTSGSSWAVDDLTVQGHALTTSESASHLHAHGSSVVEVLRSSGLIATGSSPTTRNTASSGGGQSHTHGITSAGTWRPKNVKGILCEKN